jgi:amidase
MVAFLSRLDEIGEGPRLAVKDLIDVAGTVTTAGSRALADVAEPAQVDAEVVRRARQAGARIVGKTNLHELATGGTGLNPWFGDPVNPLDPALIPGGSSSGSAVAVATGEADVAFGTDTGGSVRIPSACCGTVGLKTTFGRIPLDGVWPLCPSLDTVGPMGVDTAAVVLGMQLLEPGFTVATGPAARIGRIRLEGTDPDLDAVIDAALAAAGFEVVDVSLPNWGKVFDHFIPLYAREALDSNRELYDHHRDRLSDDVAGLFLLGSTVDDAALAEARAQQQVWRSEVDRLLEQCDLLAVSTLSIFPPRVDGAESFDPRLTAHAAPVNFSGHPALALPLSRGAARIPASLQLIGPFGGEELLCATGQVLENSTAA